MKQELKPVTFHVEPIEPGNWVYMQRSPGNLDRIDQTVKWVLEQLLLGNSDVERDDDGEVVTLTLGRGAARVPPSGEEPLEHAKRAVMCLGITGVTTRSREEGTEPQHGKLVHDLSLLAEMSNLTGFHYAFEMVKVLERISDQTFALSAPPIHGKVPEKLIWYLGEATRAHLYGLHRASIALSRSCLEEALSTKINATNQGRQRLSDYRRENAKAGYLECLVEVAAFLGYLKDACRVEEAHLVRRSGNAILHKRSVKDEDSSNTLTKMRGLLEHLFADEEF